MTSTLKYLKGVRTRYNNDLKEQINDASVILVKICPVESMKKYYKILIIVLRC